MTAGLDEKTATLIRTVLKKFPAVERAVLFGSRAKGMHAANSDIDIAFFGEIDSQLAEQISLDLNELPLPQKFDVQPYAGIKNPALKDHIDRIGITVYER
ncbi:MAG: nucleotidyltransferase domain-containing protein [Kiritimatiellales bacterium]